MKYFVLSLVLGFLAGNGLSEKLETQVPLLDEKYSDLDREAFDQEEHVFEDQLPNNAACRCDNGICVEEDGRLICKCPPGFGNYTLFKCRACDCGPETSCLFIRFFDMSSKECLCKPGYSTKSGKCEACECGPDLNCIWVPHGYMDTKKICQCKPGYHEENGKCVDPCTPNPCKSDGKCEVTEHGFKCNCTGPWRGKTCETACICRGGECVLEGGKAVCKCPPGYGNFTNISCKACDCGANMSCIWEARFGGSKICLCKPGYSTKKGKCIACECGHDSNCEWRSNGWLQPEKKVCHCKPGYHEENGKCVDIRTSSSMGTSESFLTSSTLSSTVQDCHCGSFSYSCTFDSTGNKVCNCFMGYSQLDGSCAECYCGPHGTCSFEYGQKKCNCKSFATEMSGHCIDKQDLETFCLKPLGNFP